MIKSHDGALEHVLQLISKRGLTLNPQKCEFNMSEIVYYGFLFSDDRIRPDPRKVDMIKNAERPKDAYGLNSFLCMARYSEEFIPQFSRKTT